MLIFPASDLFDDYCWIPNRQTVLWYIFGNNRARAYDRSFTDTYPFKNYSPASYPNPIAYTNSKDSFFFSIYGMIVAV